MFPVARRLQSAASMPPGVGQLVTSLAATTPQGSQRSTGARDGGLLASGGVPQAACSFGDTADTERIVSIVANAGLAPSHEA